MTVTVIHAAGHLVLPVLAIELQTKVREVFAITEKTSTRAFPWPTSAFTLKTLLGHYAKQAPKHGKQMRNWDTDTKIVTDRRL